MSQDERQWLVEQVCWLLQRKVSSAVLVNGPWGVGKTHLWKSTIEPRLREEKREPIYVSLYGVESVDRFRESIIEARLPYVQSKVGNKITKVVGTAAKTVAGMFNASQALTLVELWELSPDRHVLCVDDLERCEPDALAPVLGHLTQLVERKKVPLLLIGNELPLLEHPHYPRIKEKLIGHTYQFPSDLTATIDSVVRELSDESTLTGQFLKTRTDLLKALIEASGTANLRAVKVKSSRSVP